MQISGKRPRTLLGRLRRRHGMTLSELARRLPGQPAPGSVGRYENDTGGLEPADEREMAAILGLSVDLMRELRGARRGA